ncbi:Lipooligosaccharide biosynthesis protein lex-1, partial [Haemophilus influenzae]
IRSKWQNVLKKTTICKM